MDPIDFQMPARKYFRKRRFKNFVSDYQSCGTILDVGGAHYTWDIVGRSEGVTILSIELPEDTGGYKYILGSGCEMPFADRSFDLACSNSAIEHVGSVENQFKFASEMMRVGKRIYCQTASRLFPIDPHITTLFLHWLRFSWLTPKFLRYVTLNGCGKEPSIRRDMDLQSKTQEDVSRLQDHDGKVFVDAEIICRYELTACCRKE